MIHLNDYDLQLDVLFQEVIITQGALILANTSERSTSRTQLNRNP